MENLSVREKRVKHLRIEISVMNLGIVAQMLNPYVGIYCKRNYCEPANLSRIPTKLTDSVLYLDAVTYITGTNLDCHHVRS
ncbi:MAG: hypothetical protein ACK5RE_19885 [Pseudanabaena sp.]